MSIKYKGPAPTAAGTYLVRVDGEQLVAAEYELGDWAQPGIDYDVWQHASVVCDLEVICKLDLKAIAEAERVRNDG